MEALKYPPFPQNSQRSRMWTHWVDWDPTGSLIHKIRVDNLLQCRLLQVAKVANPSSSFPTIGLWWTVLWIKCSAYCIFGSTASAKLSLFIRKNHKPSGNIQRPPDVAMAVKKRCTTLCQLLRESESNDAKKWEIWEPNHADEHKKELPSGKASKTRLQSLHQQWMKSSKYEYYG